MQKPITAFTAPTPINGYPEYISVNEQDDGRVTITVRGPVKIPTDNLFPMPGDVVAMSMTVDEFRQFVETANAYLTAGVE